jgi:hypothetical protein
MFLRRLSGILLLSLLLLACRKDQFTDSQDALLRTSIDTLHFDTVFTSTGSITQFIKIMNDNKEGIRIGSVRLAGGLSSPFRINVDGRPGPIVNALEVAGKDSAYIFVTVSINPSAANLPFIVRDSIAINYNGKTHYVQLDAFGQNARFFRNLTISGNETWTNELPYVILGRLTVAENATLNITKSTKVHLHADAPLIVNGTLRVTGEKWDSTKVIFTGDRLDEPYRDFPASYPGIIFSETSKNNRLDYAVIKNAYQGIVAVGQAATAAPKVILNETIIDNVYDAGILAVNSSIDARNVLISNCGKNIVLVRGGRYNFNHCTAATFSSNYIQHKDPILLVSNYLNASTPPADLSATFRNCIFWGEAGLVKNEVVVEKNGNTLFNVIFDHVLWRVETAPQNNTASNIINNQNPVFDSINTSRRFYDFRLKANSPAINKGTATANNIDLDGKSRPVGLPDLGAYERQ